MCIHVLSFILSFFAAVLKTVQRFFVVSGDQCGRAVLFSYRLTKGNKKYDVDDL